MKKIKSKITKKSVNKPKRSNPIDLKDIYTWKVISYFTLMDKYLIIKNKVRDAIDDEDSISWGGEIGTTVIRMSDLLSIIEENCEFRSSIEKEEYKEFKKDTINAKNLFVSF